MNKIGIILCCSLIFNGLLMAQDDEYEQYRDENTREEYNTIFGNGDLSHGGYGAFTFGYSRINNKDAIYFGGRGGWIINHVFTMGIAGTGYFNDPNEISQDVSTNLVGGHGGIFFEPIILPKFPVHLSIPIFMGVGGMTYLEHYDDPNKNDYFRDYDNEFEDDYNTEAIDADSYFILEPGIELEFNLIRYFRISLFASRAFTSNINLDELAGDKPISKDALEDFKFGATFKFGVF